MESQERPWDKQISEPNIWYDRFHRYLMLGAARSVLESYNEELRKQAERAYKGKYVPALCAPGGWWPLIRKWRWKERAEAWDAEQRRLFELQTEERRRKLLDKEFQLSDKLAVQAEQMLAWPIAQQTIDQDGKTVILNPTDWSKRDAVEMADAASRLGRRAVGLEQSDIAVKVQQGGPASPAEDMAWIKSLANPKPPPSPPVEEKGNGHGS